MSVIEPSEDNRFQLEGVTFIGLAAPSRGARDNAVWWVEVEPGTRGVPHRLTREETFVAVAGEAWAQMDGRRVRVAAGSALLIPAGTRFALENLGPDTFRAVAILPIGGQVEMDGKPAFVPPWAA